MIETCGRVPGALPLVGHAAQLLRDPLGFLASLPGHGDLVGIRLGPLDVLVVCDPELTRRMLRDDRTFDKGGPLIDRAREVIGDGLGTCPHADHRRQRGLTQPAFHPKRLPGYARTMTEQVGAVIGGWHDGQVVDVLAETTALSMRITVAAIFATSLPPAVVDQTLDDFAAVVDGIFMRTLMPARLDALPTPGNRRYTKACDRLRRTVGRITDEYRADAADHGDLLSVLVAARDPDPAAPEGPGRSLSGEEISDQAVTFLISGTETTAALMAWTLHLLAQHPEIQRRVQDEVDTVLAGAAATHEHLPGLELTGRVLTEALRIYPPVWIVTREVTADTRLGRHLIPAGATLAYSPYLIHRRADVHRDPGTFDPDRWTGAPDRTTFLPFGGGARRCIGDTFAVTEATLAVAAIAARWHLHPVPGREVRPRPRTTLAPSGLHLRLTDRRALP